MSASTKRNYAIWKYRFRCLPKWPDISALFFHVRSFTLPIAFCDILLPEKSFETSIKRRALPRRKFFSHSPNWLCVVSKAKFSLVVWPLQNGRRWETKPFNLSDFKWVRNSRDSTIDKQGICLCTIRINDNSWKQNLWLRLDDFIPVGVVGRGASGGYPWKG